MAPPASSSAKAPVFISIYKPYDKKDPCHWAIFIAGGGANDVILQVGDDKKDKGYFVEKPMNGKQPQKSSMHKESIQVGSILAKNVATVTTIIRNTPVDNKSTTWNCQAWCVEALTALEKSKADDFKWDPKAKTAVIAKRQDWQ